LGEGQTHLLQVALAACPLGVRPRSREHREEYRREQGDNPYDDEQLDERKAHRASLQARRYISGQPWPWRFGVNVKHGESFLSVAVVEV
jgi:hypothetical protein